VFRLVSRRPVTAEARVQSQISPCDVYGGQSATGIVPPLNHTRLHLRVAFTRKINARNQGTLSKASGCCRNCWRSVRAFRVLRHVHLELRCEFREIDVIRNCDNE
jgi:hypothetical protein